MPEKEWEKLGELSNGRRAGVVAASRDGFGLVATVTEPATGTTLPERMRLRRAHVHRVTGSGMTEVYEGPGWIQALDCRGPVCAAIGATLKASGTGTDYHLLMSEDAGRAWQERGPVDALSVSQVLAVSPTEVWVLGAGYLGRTLDGGATWKELTLEGERNPAVEKLRREEGGVALLGHGLALTTDGGATWTREPMGGARVYDVSGPYEVAAVEGAVRIGERQGEDVRLLASLPEGREPLKLGAAEGVVRLLSRNADPSKGVDLALHFSEDGGASWSHRPLPLGPPTDIAGLYGLGVDAQGHVLGQLAAPAPAADVSEPREAPAHQPE